MKLEKKNVELEKNLDDALSATSKEEAAKLKLQNTVCLLQSQIKDLETQLSNLIERNSKNEVSIFTLFYLKVFSLFLTKMHI